LSSINCTRVSILVPVAVSAFATDSVEGQRARPSEVMRFDLLNVVGSSPDFLARPDGESPARAARRSRAVPIWAGVSMGIEAGPNARGEFCPNIGIIAFERPSNFRDQNQEVQSEVRLHFAALVRENRNLKRRCA